MRRNCPRRIFTERLPAVVRPHARSTTRYSTALYVVGAALGGNPGARLARKLGIAASLATLLRTLASGSTAMSPFPRVIGVDDFAKRRGYSYGTIIVDLERHCPIALLADRSASTLATRLITQPTVEIICSDRSTEYARGIAEGAPHAMPVADHWHPLKNHREALERLLGRHKGVLRDISLPTSRPKFAATTPNPDTEPIQKPPERSPREVTIRRAKRERRQSRFAQVRELHSQGMSVRGIADQLGMHRATVTRYIQADAFPERASRRPFPDILALYRDHLQRRWDEGCRNGLEPLREIKVLGYPVSRKQLAHWVRERRETPASTTPTKYVAARKEPPLPVRESSFAVRRASTRQLSWLMVQRPERLEEAEQSALVQMRELCPEVATAYPLAQKFTEIVRRRQTDDFTAWLKTVSTSDVSELTTFAAGLRRDEKAVSAALRLGWSNGQTERQVTRLKLLKRQMFGRASLALLRRRVLEAA